APRPRPAPLPAVPAPGAARAALQQAEVAYGMSAGELQRLGVPALHDSGYTGSRVFVAMIDDGFNYYKKNTATRSTIVTSRTRDFIRGITDVQDTTDFDQSAFDHGEWTLSTIGANAPGILVGPAYGATFALARTENNDSEKPIEMVYWQMAAEWADSLGVDIISSSLGYNLFPDSSVVAGTDSSTNLTYDKLDGHTSIVTRAAEIAASRGMLVVVSAGNDGQNASVGYKVGAPADANGDSVLAIAAVDSLGVRAAFSSKGPTVDGRIKPDLAAQGVRVWTAATNGDPNSYQTNSGTSFSCPLVAGLAACLWQARPTWTAVMVARALKETASQATHPDTLLGYGIPNGAAALKWIPDTATAPPVPAPLAFALLGRNPVRAGDPPLRFAIGLPPDARPVAARLDAFDAGGRRVRALWAGTIAAGERLATVSWTGDDDRGRALPGGLYFLALTGGGHRSVLRIVLVR
ncbi:MAG TPA: S8 family serine peptidase, partial [Candidatus Eisenbacteria bacterium]|nr:S8 family serine peptidase [Candidatus Eisenbacteria bacterium]